MAKALSKFTIIMRSCTVHLEACSGWSTALLLFICVCCFCHTRTVQLTVSNTLVGRIIGRGGSKINSIQVHAHKHLFECMGCGFVVRWLEIRMKTEAYEAAVWWQIFEGENFHKF